MQATIHTFDEGTGDGSVITDNGRVLAFPAAVFAVSHLRLVRPGQRVNIEVGATGVERLWIAGIGPGQRIR